MRFREKVIFAVCLLFFLAAPLFFAAADTQISVAVPGTQGTPCADPNAQGCNPGVMINSFYSFAFMIAGILALGAVTYGGIRYATSAGNPSSQGEGRQWIESALLGLLLLAAAYLILYFVNPGLVNLNLPMLKQLSGTGWVSGGSTTGSTAGTGTPSNRCQAPTNGPCSMAQLQGSCFSNPQLAAGVCNVESSGNANAQGDRGDDGNYASIGLFQINLSANTIQDPTTGKTLNCPAAFSNPYTGSNPHTHVVDQALYQQCLAAAKNPATNIAKACALASSRSGWKQWGPATVRQCGL